MRIGELSKRTDVSVDTLRFYAKEGLLNYHANGHYWNFDDSQVEKVKQILIFRNIGFSIKEIHYIFHASEKLLDGVNVKKEKVTEYEEFFKRKAVELDKQSKEIERAKQRVDKIIEKLKLLEEMEAFK